MPSSNAIGRRRVLWCERSHHDGLTRAIIALTFAGLSPAEATLQDKATATKQRVAHYLARKAAKTNNTNIPCINIERITSKKRPVHFCHGAF